MPREADPNSLRQRLYQLWVSNEDLSPKNYANLLGVSYKEKGGYINKLLSVFRNCHYFEKVQNLQVAHKRSAEWEFITFDRESALERGWVESGNRNRKLIFYDESRGSVDWFTNGHVILHLKGSIPNRQKLARIKELFCRAFSWFGEEEWKRYLDCPIRETGKHWTFDVGAELPYIDIRTFEKSHGIHIYTDGSHPTSIEIAESSPFWLDRLEAVQEQFAENLDSHLRMIKSVDMLAKSLESRSRHKGLLGRFMEWLF